MTGEMELQRLLATMKPQLWAGEFVFCTVPLDIFAYLNVQPIGWFREEEGITLIVERSRADKAGLAYEYVSRMITLTVHSSLEAVGFLAAVAAKLTAGGISVNPVSAYYHDHLFVPVQKAERAMELLHQLMREALTERTDES